MEFGFTVLNRPSGVEVEVAGRGPNPHPLVSLSRQEEDFAVLAGRLRYREALRDRLVASERPGENDAALALGAYHALGLEGLEAIEGDFALAIWDSKDRRLIGCRDPLGGYPLFWTETSSISAFSTSLERLLPYQPRRALNLEYCAEFLMMPAQWNEGGSEVCAYEGIRRVLPGTLVSLAPSCEAPRRRKYWIWHERIEDPGTGDIPEIAERYAVLLRTAVREHIQGTALVHFSGGMDSTSIALMAGILAQEGQVSHPVHTVSLEYDRIPDLKRESPYIDAALEVAEGIVPHRVAADGILDYDSFPEPPDLEEPYAGLWRLSMDRVSIELAARIGASTVLSGIGADEIHHLLPYHLADSLRQGKLRETWSEATRWARKYNCSPWTVLQEYAALPGTALWRMRRSICSLLRRSAGPLSAQDDWTVPPWIEPRFARNYHLAERAMAHARRREDGAAHNTVLSQALRTLSNRPGDVVRWSVAAPLGIAYAHPFFDTRILAFGLGILTRIKPEPGLMKPVLAEAMRDVLPASIRDRRSKVGFNAIYFKGIGRNLPYLESMIESAPEAAWRLFDRKILLENLQEASLAGTGVRKLQRLNYTLGLIRWLCMPGQSR